jgi:hypothetical protein
VQRHLGRLADDREDQQQSDRRGVARLLEAGGVDQVADAVGAVGLAEHDDRHEQSDVGDARDDERLGRAGARLRLLPGMPDQQVRADAHHLPADEQHEQVVGGDDGDHRDQEQHDE